MHKDEAAKVEPRSYSRVVAHIEARVQDGSLRPGDRLPSERELSELVGVSRASTREALRVLEALEVVRIQSGSGRGSGSILAESSGDALTELLRLSLALGHFTVRDIVDTRIALESWAARELAAHHDQEQLAVLSNILDAIESNPRDGAALVALDAEYHIAIARLSGSGLVIDLMEGMRTAIRQWMTTGAEYVVDWRSASRRLREEHREIYACIERGDGNGAASAIERHLHGFYDGLISQHTPPESA